MKSGCNCSRRNQAGSSAATWIPHAAVPRVDRRAGALHRGSRRRTGRARREPVRDPRRGLDSFVQRRPEMASRVTVFEVDPPAPQARRLVELGFGVPDWLRFVPVDFEAKQSWRAALVGAGFDAGKPAVVVSTGVSMYLTHEANAAALREVASLAPATLAMTFLLPLEHADPDVRPGWKWPRRARAPAARRSSASSCRRRSRRSRVRPVSQGRARIGRRTDAPLLPIAPTACGRRITRKSCWPRRSEVLRP